MSNPIHPRTSMSLIKFHNSALDLLLKGRRTLWMDSYPQLTKVRTELYVKTQKFSLSMQRKTWILRDIHLLERLLNDNNICMRKWWLWVCQQRRPVPMAINVPKVPPPWIMTLPTLLISSRPLAPYLWLIKIKGICYRWLIISKWINILCTWEQRSHQRGHLMPCLCKIP